MTTPPTPTTPPTRSGHDRGHPDAEPPVQRTTGRWAALAPIGPRDLEALRALELGDRLGVRWRLRGRTPGPAEWEQSLWHGVLAQHLVVRRRDERILGLVCAYDPDLQDGTCSVGFARFDDATSPAFAEGVLLFVDHLFATWPLRKLCGESAEFNLAGFASVLAGLAVEEGRRVDQLYVDGRHWDLVLLALWRETWLARRDQLLPGDIDRLGGPDRPTEDPRDAVVDVVVPS